MKKQFGMFFWDPVGETNLDHPDQKHVPMQRGARFGFAGSVLMQRGVRFFEEIAFSCSVGRCCLVMRLKNNLRFPVLGEPPFLSFRSGALFFDVPWPSVPCL